MNVKSIIVKLLAALVILSLALCISWYLYEKNMEDTIREAIRTKDLTVCEKMFYFPSEGFKYSCYWGALANIDDPTVCERISPKWQNWCYSFMASELYDTSLCAKVQDEAWKKDCIDRANSSAPPSTRILIVR